MKRAACGCHSHNGFVLSPEGLAQRGGDAPGVDGVASSQYLDRVGSVSGLQRQRDLFEDVDDALIDEQDRRFYNGS